MTTRKTLADLLPGDKIAATGEVVAGIQQIGPVVIVDFTNSTATPPLPAGGWTEVEDES